MQISSTNLGPPSSLHWRNSGAGIARERGYSCWSSGCYVHPGWSSDVFGYLPLWRTVQRQTTVPIPYNPELSSTFCGRHVNSGANVFGLFLFVCYHFFQPPFYTVTYRTFCDVALIFQAQIFRFCNTCLFVTSRTSFGVAGPNIILLYSGMASNSVDCTTFTMHKENWSFFCNNQWTKLF